jgi:transposase
VSEAKIYVGMDVHKDSISLAALLPGRDHHEPVVRLEHDLRKVRRYMDRLAKQGEIRACYEASGAGFVLQRAMVEWGYSCEVIAPSMIPRRPGDRRKNDVRDAIELARLYRSGDLVPVRIPSEADEKVRDLVRCRQAMQKNLIAARHQVTKFLTRRNVFYPGKSRWTAGHMKWLAELRSALEGPDKIVFDEYLSHVEYVLGRRDALDREIELQAGLPTYKERVDRLRCFYAVDVLTAMVLLTEIGDFGRFRSPLQLMGFIGLVPREYSSGEKERRGSITKSGNSRVRHVLVQAAWNLGKVPRKPGLELSRRREGQPAHVVAHAIKARKRLHERFSKLTFRKGRPIAAVAVAREFAGFIWAVMK